MTCTLEYNSRIGLWELQINRCRRRFFVRYAEAIKLIKRYRRAVVSRG